MSKLLKSKYNITGDRCVDACLNYGELRYVDKDGLSINIEIPYDKYEEAMIDYCYVYGLDDYWYYFSVGEFDEVKLIKIDYEEIVQILNED